MISLDQSEASIQVSTTNQGPVFKCLPIRGQYSGHVICLVSGKDGAQRVNVESHHRSSGYLYITVCFKGSIPLLFGSGFGSGLLVIPHVILPGLAISALCQARKDS